MKKLIVKYGFTIIYNKHILIRSNDDGFYFSIAYLGFTDGELLEKLLDYGTSAVALKNNGSEIEGFRDCFSQTDGS